MTGSRQAQLRRMLAASALTPMLLAAPALAQEFDRPVNVDIPAQSLAAALNELGRETGTNILYTASSVTALQAPPVHGVMSARAAIRRLIAGAPLQVSVDQQGALIVRRLPQVQPTALIQTAPSGVTPAAPDAAPPSPSAVPPAGAAAAHEPTPVQQEVVVTGLRRSLSTAQGIKESAGQIVDSIVADDIGKLPDVSVSDALQRITGVQITRDAGDGGQVTIRGLPQVQTLLNGREIFSASGTRGLNPEDFPADLVAGLDVYKTPTADQVEGGLGGIIDVRTRKPFDFKGLEMSGTARGIYGDLVQQATPQVSGLISDRWSTGIGDVGALLSVAYQERKYREDLSSIGAPAVSNTIIPGQSVVANTGTYDVLPVGDRTRIGVDGTLQWRPQANLEFYLQGDYTEYKSIQSALGASVNTAGLTAAPGATLFSGTNDIRTVTYNNAPLSVLGYTYDTVDKNTQISTGGKWRATDRLTVTGDFSYTSATGTSLFSDLQIDTTLPTFSQNLTGSPQAATYSGVNLLDPAAFHYSTDGYTYAQYSGDEKALRLDANYKLDLGPIREVQIGFRYADRRADFQQNTDYLSLNGPNVASVPGLVSPTPYPDFFSRTDPNTPLFRNYLGAIVDKLRNDPSGVRAQLGLSPTLPGVDPLSLFHVDEKTTGGYFMVRYAFNLLFPIDGNVGVRVVGTEEKLNGNQTLADGSVAPINLNNSYIDALPSFNARVKFTKSLFLRLAASQVITRPDFSNLSPSLTLNPAFLSGSAGNPNLQPLRANQYDASLEWYFTRTSSIYVAGFYKDVNGFVNTVGVPETHFGQTYTITRPQNGNSGQIKGAEFGYQQFFDFLPGLLSGLGAQANYTYVDSKAPSSVAGQSTTLPQLSRNSYNLVALYEKGPVSARVAYNWRDQYYERIYVGGAGIGVNPIYRGAFGWLDASITYNVNDHLSVMLEGSNLLQTKRSSFYRTTYLPNETEIDDRQILFGARYHF